MDVQLPGLAITLIVVLAADAIACAIPVPYIKNDLDRLGCSTRLQRIIPLVKFAAVAGLILGLWNPRLGAIACIAMLLYFGFAFWFHYNAGDALAKYLPGIAFSGLITATLYLSYLAAV